MSRLAFMTFAVFSHPSSHKSHATFMELATVIFRQLGTFDGFIDASVLLNGTLYYYSDQDPSVWGEAANPSFAHVGQDITQLPTVLTLSLWKSIESVRYFAYNGLHETALIRRKEWFLPPRWPTYAMWWVEDEVFPTYASASRRLEILHSQKSSPVAFDFATPFFPADAAVLPSTAR
jgi:hypothetical protein